MKEGWEMKKMGDLTEVITKGTTPTSVGHKFINEGINFVKVESISLNSHFIKEKFAFISDEANEALKRSQLKEGDILFSIAGALGRTAIVSDTILPANTNQALAIIRLKPNLEILKEYVFKALSSGYALKQIEKYKGGVAQMNLSLGQMKSFQIPIPPLEEQKQIVAILDQAFTAIDQAKANIEKNIENAKELFQSKLNDIFSQKGDGWKEMTLGEVCEKTKNIKWQDFSNEEFEYVDLSSVSRETLSVTETATVNKENAPSRAKKIIFEGDVIFATTRPTLKRATIIKEDLSGNLCSTGYVVLRPKENISSDWIFFYLLTSKFMDRMESLQRGASYPAVSDNDVKGSKLAVPASTLEAKKNILIMNNLQENTNFLVDNYINKLNNLEDLKKSILQKAFTGELTQKEVMV